MGWMSWGIFRCQLDCASHPNDCIDESLYTSTADALASDGFADAGYRTVHMDDCWQNGPKGAPSGGRDPTTKRLVANTSRFPNGMKAVAAKVHAMNISFASYTAEGAKTCGQYSGSAGHEARDAATFADWGVRLLRGMLLLRRSLSLSVSLSRARENACPQNCRSTEPATYRCSPEQVDYLKVDGCGSLAYYATGYPAMGAALASSGRSIVYSCSWPVTISIRCHAAGLQPTTGQFSLCHSAAPACLNFNPGSSSWLFTVTMQVYIQGENKPYQKMLDAGCNTWRAFSDVLCRWDGMSGGVAGIIDYWGDHAKSMQPFAGPTKGWHDPVS